MNTRLVKLMFATQWVLYVGPFIGLTMLLFGPSVFELWVDTDEDSILIVLSAWFGFGAIFGCLGGWVEQLPSHREFMIHRGIAPRSYLFTKHWVSVAFASLPWFGSVVVAAWIARTWSPDGVLIDASGVTRVLALGSVGIIGYSLGVWCTTLRARIAALIAMILLVAGAVVLAEWLLVTPTATEPAPSIARFVAFQVAAWVLLSVATTLNYQRAHDPDRPVPIAAQLGHASIVGLAISFVVCVAASALQAAIVEHGTGYPIIAETTDRGFGLFDVVEHDLDVLLVPVDDRHEPIGEPVRQSALRRSSVYAPSSLARLLDRDGSSGGPIPLVRGDLRLGAAKQSLLFHPYQHLLLEQPSGRLLFCRLGTVHWQDQTAERIQAARAELKRPDGRPFGPKTTVLGVNSSIGRNDFSRTSLPLVLGDPGDGTLWRVTFESEPRAVEPVALPGGDRFVSWEWTAAAEPNHRNDRGDLSAVIVDGASGRYVVDAQGHAESTAAERAPWSALYFGPSGMLRATESKDPFFVRIEVIGDDGKAGSVAFAHDYAPRRPRERAAHTACVALALLRPPLATDLSVPGVKFDRHLKGFENPWLAFILASLLAAQAAFLLRGRGACAKRTSLWTSLILVLGPGAFIAFLLLERKAAFARMPREAVEEPRLPRVVETIAAAT